MRYAKYYVVLFIIAQLVLVGCQSGSNIIRNEKYNRLRLTGKSVAISPVPLDVITVQNKDDAEDDFETDKRKPEVIVQDSLYQKIVRQAGNSLFRNKVHPALPFDKFPALHDSASFFGVSCKMKDDGKDTLVTFFVPKKEIFGEQAPNAVVIINRIVIGRNLSGRSLSMPTYMPGPTISTPGGSFQGAGMWVGGGGSSEYLGGIVEYIMWSYDENEPISYGVTNVADKFLFGMTNNVWHNLFRQVGKKLFEDSPFEWIGTRY